MQHCCSFLANLYQEKEYHMFSCWITFEFLSYVIICSLETFHLLQFIEQRYINDNNLIEKF